MKIVGEIENRKRRMGNPVMTSCSPTHPGCAIRRCSTTSCACYSAIRQCSTTSSACYSLPLDGVVQVIRMLFFTHATYVYAHCVMYNFVHIFQRTALQYKSGALHYIRRSSSIQNQKKKTFSIVVTVFLIFNNLVTHQCCNGG